MMMTMDQSSGFGNPLTDYTNQTNSLIHPDVDWSVFENADRYLLRDDSAWITRLSKDFWWNLERISEMVTKPINLVEQINSTKIHPQQVSSSIQSNGTSARKIIGQRSTITRPNPNNIPDKANFSSIYDQDIEYNPFQSKISFDNNIWTNYSQQAIPWQ
ncbi:unnamed protein product [Adineta steineri]|uniref:Uncharacterized protein n=1 Tax=Adineta steineri TaxID=433720 RepID=A0A814CE78_9BILA|nr:unnamed protein product [Adineta steineri]CAF1203162.1 unnamed protein product [Adineta steineri]